MTTEFVLDLTVLLPVVCWEKEASIGNRFLTQARQIYGKSITVLFKYMINQTEKDTIDGSYSYRYNSKWPIPLFSWNRQLLSKSGYGHLTPNEMIFIQAINLIPALHLHVLSSVVQHPYRLHPTAPILQKKRLRLKSD